MDDTYSFDDELAVEAAHDRFYRALEDADIDAMDELWLHEDWVKCVHPGWDLLAGWEQVRDSWERIFDNATGMRVAANDVEIRIVGDFAWVTCNEILAIFLPGSAAPAAATIIATNLFYRVGDDWLMVHHHASQIPDEPTITESDLIQ